MNMGPGGGPGPILNKGMYMRRSAPYSNPHMVKGRQVPGGQQYPNGTQVIYCPSGTLGIYRKYLMFCCYIWIFFVHE